MRLYITPHCLISDIKKDFNEIFPFLKLEFFNNKSFSRSDYTATHIIPPGRKLSESQLTLKEGEIEIDNDMKVSELEKRFRDQFSLAVKIFRKSGNLWLETTMTDNWTLQQQNNHGQEISTVRKSNPEIEDFDLNRDADH